MITKLCRHCGDVKSSDLFPRNAKMRDGIDSWCKACHSEAVRRAPSQVAKRVGKRPCATCGGPEVQAPQRFCSPSCRPSSVRPYHIPRPRRNETCAYCGSPFMALRSIDRFCAEPCKDGYFRTDRRQKAKLAFRERVIRGKVIERCQKAVDLSGEPGPWAPAVDHVIPLARGGEHSYANVQLAHRRCNGKKGARLNWVAA